MTFEFELPDPGEGLTEAEIVEWSVAEGDEVAEDDVLGEVETDKAVTEIPSPVSGTIQKITADEGDVVDVGTVIVVFDTDEEGDEEEAAESAAEKADEQTEETTEGEDEEGGEEASEGEAEEEEEAEGEAEGGEAEGEEEAEQAVTEVGEEGAEEAEAEPAEAEPAEAETEEPETEEGRVFAAPSTRRYAREQGVDLGDVDGSGPDGRVLREDIEEYTEEGEAAEAAEVGALHPSVEIEPTAVDEDESRSERRDLSGLRAQIAENMTRSKTVIPHLTSEFEADAEALVELKERLDEKHDTHITYTPLFLKAVVPALKEFPLVNASIDDTTDEIVEKNYYNVGFATHTDDGLLVPVIDDVDAKSVVEVAEELNDLAEQAREREIDVADLQGGTFTVTNLALHGEHRTGGTPVINHPEAAILGIGHIREKPVARDGNLEVRNRVTLSLSYDHRLVDGVTANEFTEHVIEGIEDPDILLSRL
ncbi:dihydrolipoamide acetyltransferase family protein [Halococcus agarilyticus]|uniref:dihydrolipoamide acetyltransferase family protein n=1 Tax=Halococcus agarilyticus TaxID=1232219 RepID=UPI0006782313|nr:dihydrolipoamide acetyltransferase family protein [Halococcus agarilyticus]